MKKKRVLMIIAAVLACGIAVLSILLATHVICPVHDWKPATCTVPRTCAKCGRTLGDALGHDWLDATCEEPETCSRCGKTKGKALGHEWIEATCTEPKTCQVCGARDGTALGHNWKAATCTEPKSCLRCGISEGDALGHDWQDATCTEPMTCSRCKATQGEALGHTPGEWKIADDDIVTGTYWMKQYCSVCQEQLDAELYSYTSYLQNGEFTITPKEFTRRLDLCLDLIQDNTMSTGMRTIDNGDAVCAVWNYDTTVTALTFSLDGTGISEGSADSSHMDQLLGYCTGDDRESVMRLLVALPLACDPSLEFDECKAVASQLVEKNVCTKNGIQYTFASYSDGYAVMVTVP